MVSITAIVLQGAVLGLVATLAMDLVMGRLREGATAPYVAASVLTGVSPEAVTERRATAVHYAAGIASGVLFLGLLEGAWTVLGIGSASFGLRGFVGLLVSAGLLLGWLVGVFVLVVLPRYERGFGRQRLRAIRRDWALAATTQVGALVVLWLLLTRLV